jgi:hypothetical protein
MAESRNRQFAKLAKDITSAGDIKESGISSDVSLGGATIYATRASLPASGNTAGDQAYVTGNNRLYIWNGSGWYNVALLNVAPSIQSVLDSDSGTTPFSLAIDGTPTTITITALDSDGDPITYAATSDSDFAGLATLSQADNVFTVTPLSSDSATTSSGTITFTATDGINVASSGVQTFTLTFLSSLWNETILSIGTPSTNSLDNSTFIDRSTNALTVTTTNTPDQTAFHPYLDYWSVEFSQGYQRFLQNTSIPGMGTSDFTIEAWIWHNGDLSEDQTIFANAGTTSAAVSSISFQLTATNGYLQLGRYFKGNSTGTTAVAANQWVHVAVERSGSNVYLYVNGQQETKTIAADESYGFSGGFRIGEHWDTSSNSGKAFGGYISNLRVVKGSLVYNGSFTPPTEKLTAVTNTVLLTCQDNRFKDNSTNDYALTINDTYGESSHFNPRISAFNPFGQGSEYALGENKGSVYLATGDEVVIAHNSAISAGTGDFCLQFWTYAAVADNGGYKGLVAKYSASTGSIWMQPNSGVITCGFATSVEGTGTTNIFDTQWHHIAFTRSGTAVKVFVDGVQDISFTSSANLNNTADMLIGDIGALGRNFKGYVADLKYDVGNAVYTSAFTPPTSPVGNTNADLYLPMDNAGIFDKTGNQTLTLVGDVSTSTTQTKFATTAMYFDGTGDYVSIPDKSVFDFVGNFTIEFWMYHTSTSDGGYTAVFGGNGSGTNGWHIYMQESSGNLYFFYSSFLISATSALTVNTWHHIAVTRSGSDIKMFVDGTQVGSTATSSATLLQNSTGAGTRIGYDHGANGYYEGYIEGVQVIVGAAKYTANFTAPTQEQGRTYQAES